MAGQEGEESRVQDEKNSGVTQELIKLWHDKKVRAGFRIRRKRITASRRRCSKCGRTGM